MTDTKEQELFEKALRVKPPLFISNLELDLKRKHLDFFDNKCYIHYWASRIKIAERGIKLISPALGRA